MNICPVKSFFSVIGRIIIQYNEYWLELLVMEKCGDGIFALKRINLILTMLSEELVKMCTKKCIQVLKLND